MIKVKYVGSKEAGTVDSEAGTGTIWAAPGDVQEVPDTAWPKLQKHPDVWERVEDEVVIAAAPAPAPPAADVIEDGTELTVITTPQGPFVLDGMSRDDLRALAAQLGVTVHHAAGIPKITTALIEAFPPVDEVPSAPAVPPVVDTPAAPAPAPAPAEPQA